MTADPAPKQTPPLDPSRRTVDFFAWMLAVGDPATLRMESDEEIDAFAHENRDHFRAEARRHIAAASHQKRSTA